MAELVIKMKMADYERNWDNKNRRWVYTHRVVVEKILGRKLAQEEHVHHIDGNPRNNNPGNLKVVSPQEHVAIHKPAKKKDKGCSVEGCSNKHHARGLCRYHYRKEHDDKWHGDRY